MNEERELITLTGKGLAARYVMYKELSVMQYYRAIVNIIGLSFMIKLDYNPL